MDSLVRSLLLLLLPVLVLSEDLPESWQPGNYTNSTSDALRFLSDYNSTAEEVLFYTASAIWNYDTNITKYNSKLQVKAELKGQAFIQAWGVKAKEIFTEKFLDSLPNPKDKRLMSGIKVLGTANLPQAEREEFNTILSIMEGIFATAKVHPEPNISWSLNPDLTEVMAKNRSYKQLLFAWEGWHNAAGVPLKQYYPRYVELINKAAQADGYEDTGAVWRSWFESETFEQDIEKLFKTIKPLYLNLHAFVRRHLYNFYGPKYINLKGPIPAHLLGNMWAQNWNNIYDMMIPFPKKPNLDVTNEMVKQGYNATRMFRVAEKFFTSLGFEEVPREFWEKSIFVKPKDREVVCQASAWDFGNRKDFRVLQCTKVTMEQLITVHRLMGDIQYFLQYKDQHVGFRDGANPGFHEAIGDLMALSVSTPNHLHKINLLESAASDTETDFNYLLKMALETIAFLPFGYLIDLWRWSVFSGITTPDNYNSDWWHLRTKYQGICPPIKRTEEHFDPGAKYHIPGNYPYISYFVSFILQFQFHEKLCQAANHTGPLHTCDIYQSAEAGTILKQVLQAGSSKPWPDVLQDAIGTREMNASSLIKYFEPVTKWLEEQNVNETLGWPEFAWVPPIPEGYPEDIADMVNSTSDALRFLSDYNSTAEEVLFYSVSASWNYDTNITEYNSKLQVKAELEEEAFTEAWGVKAKETFSDKFLDSLPNPKDKRLMSGIKVLGAANLPQAEREEFNTILSTMEGIYSTAKVHPEPNISWSMDPDLTGIMARNRSYKQLLFAWEGWHNAAGVPLKKYYPRFVELSNKAAQADGYEDTGAYWRSWYESETFGQDIEKLFKTIKPLYLNLHAFVRRQLYNFYGPKYINLKGPIPAHLLGNMWAQTWNNIYDMMIPFPKKPNLDVTNEMVKQGYNASRMFHVAEEFFTSLGLEAMPREFWEKSILVKPKDREVVCQGSAWDFGNHKDFRILQCTTVTMEQLLTVHRNMGVIEYFLQYKDQPAGFRSGANPGFLQAIGNTIALSVSTPNHLHKINLLESAASDAETDLNFLLKMALEEIAFLPFGYLIDHWRWNVFSGSTTPDNYNSDWWHLRTKYQGICPPIRRTEEQFDPGAKYHIPGNYPYISYFVSFILEFQFHEKLCQAANHTGPLHTCDIYQSAEAGAILKKLLQSGSSRPWPDVLQDAIGTREMNANSLMKYFEPVTKWLEKQNVNETLGWPEYAWVPPIPEGYPQA
ncbi:angiotensin-converting enzyme-like [Nematolebias whitei]|uniref:angiotensin-converting enzyme-like n=1 Tax=Nematolebias whitei TaxID=451745 RepID=UPI001896F343|nr:angiotensin-converting enzyme-like [Nematolebias whitei]